MTIQMQCSGIAMLLVLLYFHCRHKQTGLITQQVFRWVLWTALVCLVLDAGSILVINNADRWGLPQLLVDYVAKAYLLTLPAIGVATLLYLCADIYYDQPKKLENCGFTFGLMGLLGMIAIFVLPIAYETNDAGVVTNTAGPSMYAAYVLVTAYLALITFHLIRDRAHLSHVRLVAVILWMGLWVGAFIAQLVDHSILLAGFACAVGILILYLALENPEGNFDRATGLFSAPVLTSYLRQAYSRPGDFTAMLLLFDGPMDRGSGKNSADLIRQEVGRYIQSHQNWTAFRQSEVKIFFVFDRPRDAREAQQKVVRFVAERWPDAEAMSVRLHWLLVPSARLVSGYTSLLYLMRYLGHRHYFQEDLLEVDEKIVADVHRDLEVEALLDAAIQNDTIEVFFQPIYSTRERRITSAEALVRIRDEEGNLLPPGVFIPIAESNGMIVALGRLIFEHVCRFIKAHPLEELGLSYIESNLSMIQCASSDLATDYIDIMRRFGVTPQNINLEITESASTSAKTVLLKNMGQLISFGTSFSLDDFGTGQSNLDYIIDLPVTIAKFDRAMTQSYFTNQKAKQVMNAAIRMIHDMGLSIVSEGVETIEELRAIQALGVEYVQGFYFSKPLSPQEFLDYLAAFQPPEDTEAAS